MDKTQRLRGMRTSIVAQRAAVAGSCAVFLGMEMWKGGKAGKYGLLTGLIALACMEKVAAVVNTVSIEKDWVS